MWLIETLLLSKWLEIPREEIEEILAPYLKSGFFITRRDLWKIIVAGANLDTDVMIKYEERWRIARSQTGRLTVNAGQRARIFERDGNRCRYCGKRVNRDSRVIDHVVAWANGGRNTDDNLVTACRTCNHRKGTLSVEEAGMHLLPLPDAQLTGIQVDRPREKRKRHPNGLGTVCKRKDGRWTAAISVDGGKRKYLYAATRREVIDKLYDYHRGLRTSSEGQDALRN